VTLGELLSAFKDAAEDAEELKIREENRIAHQAELGDYLNNIGSRMHNEDLEGDIYRCWSALRNACQKSGSSKVKVAQVMAELNDILLAENGHIEQGYQEESKVASFIASLFLTHRGFALISQDEVPYGDIMLEDLWPNVIGFKEIKKIIEDKKEVQSNTFDDEETGSIQFAKRRAEKLRIKQEKAKKQSEQEQMQSPVEDDLPEHEWLVE